MVIAKQMETMEASGISKYMTATEKYDEILRTTKLLITDYSSICMGTVLINKPVVFYAYDLDSYNENRSFYYDYESTVPGPVAHNMNELGKVLRAFEFREDKRLKFRTMMFGDDKDINGDATKKMLDQIL